MIIICSVNCGAERQMNCSDDRLEEQQVRSGGGGFPSRNEMIPPRRRNVLVGDDFDAGAANAAQLTLLYKSLFTENSVATQKQYSTSINTNKIHIQRSSPSHHHSSPNLIIYYILLQNWQKPFTVEMYHTINLSCLFKIIARSVKSEVALTIFYYYL